MNRLFTPGIECTDPDSLQFCLRISDTKYWYCQPNIYHRDLFPDADTPARHILCHYLGYPDDFLRDMHTDAADFSRKEQEALLADYGYKWESFASDAERNRIICENHFEQYPLDYRNDI